MSNEHIKPNRLAKTEYINYFEIGYNAGEFVIDLGQFDSEGEQANWRMRVITGPIYAKMLSAVLIRSVKGLERLYGQTTSHRTYGWNRGRRRHHIANCLVL